MNRVTLWTLSIGLAASCALADSIGLQIPPVRQPTNAPQLSRLLEDSHGKPISSKRNWLEHRKQLKNCWVSFLGGLPAVKAPLKSEVLTTENLTGFTRQFVKYQVEEGLYTDGYLLRPTASKGKLPAVVVFHPTTPLQARSMVGLAPEYPEENRQGVQLVRRGYVVWCPRNFIETPGADWAGNTARVVARHPGWTGMTRMVWDAIRAADFVESLPNVDRKRIGCIGHSLGGKEVLYAMAFDERYRAGVSSEGGISLKFSNWAAPWFLGSKIKQPNFNLENHQVLALTAPRAFLLLAGDSIDDDRSWEFILAAKQVYDLLGASENLGWLNHHMGHRYPTEARAAAEAFLDRHLKH